ncbi:hypothetical protein VNO77_27836 [Canavalia gladiata]|uniref:Uncharacterized protein n=1 Tax=Canavalia gladiata TaxID=3824 RepID=A0AAN9QAV8_CANGL
MLASEYDVQADWFRENMSGHAILKNWVETSNCRTRSIVEKTDFIKHVNDDHMVEKKLGVISCLSGKL